MSEFEGRVVMITGCARFKGLGRSMALAFANEGAKLVVSDIKPSGTKQPGEDVDVGAQDAWAGLDSLVDEIKGMGREALAVLGNVSQRADVERMVGEAVRHFGHIDILVNNAAAPQGADRASFWEIPEEAWNLVLAVNLNGAFLMSQAVTRQMLGRGEGGRIINIASISGKIGTAKRAAYDTSKFGLIGLTQVMGMELAPFGITVNAICPGAVATDRQESTVRREKRATEAATIDTVPVFSRPVPRLGLPEDIARMALFLASRKSDYITRQAFNVDGGMVTH